MTWQPIETAPKDGTEILVWHGVDDNSDGIAAIVYWQDGEWVSPDYCIYDPVGWIAIPDAPQLPAKP